MRGGHLCERSPITLVFVNRVIRLSNSVQVRRRRCISRDEAKRSFRIICFTKITHTSAPSIQPDLYCGPLLLYGFSKSITRCKLLRDAVGAVRPLDDDCPLHLYGYTVMPLFTRQRK
ncbi:hypothetical protein FJTKL_13431 [Diaporthe vaccinii]|uniref:Uncharacterized protein n=1 Tax=Diaporthe vaccinii TaxID=105482 RepID=A0ABR4EAB0_9PEZI